MRDGKYVFSQFGAGRIGQIHADNIFRNERSTLKYVVDLNTDSAQQLASKYGANSASDEEALSDDEVDAVIICSPTSTHADLMERSALAGKAVFTEKPIDLDLGRVNQVRETINEANVTAFVGFNRRFDTTLGALGTQAESGKIGNVETVIITSRDPSPPPVGYIHSSGGLFLDMMIHDFDMACWLLSETPKEVFARGSNLVDPEIGNAGDIDTAVVTMTTPSGKLCQISNSRRATYGYDQRIEVFGSKGMLRAENKPENFLETWDESGISQPKPLNFFLERYETAYRNELEHFLDCLEKQKKPLVGVDEGRMALVLALAAKKSLETGEPVNIDTV